MKKSNGLITIRSATRPTVIERWSTFSGKTSRATQLPNGSCCQLMKWFAGLTSSEYASIGRPGVRRGPQPHHVRGDIHRSGEGVPGVVRERDLCGHSHSVAQICCVRVSYPRSRRPARLQPHSETEEIPLGFAIPLQSRGHVSRAVRGASIRRRARAGRGTRRPSGTRPRRAGASRTQWFSSG